MSTASIQRFLTGITTTGTPHLGNYVGSIRPSVAASRLPGVQSFYFLADYHALIKCDEPARIQRSTLEIAASWLAAGLDPERVTFYRQSDIPEIPELTWLLTCVTGKGMLNRAHAYKAMLDKNAAAGTDPDTDVTAGLFMYPILMAADILMFKTHKVPVGRDQIQHIEMASDIAKRFNHLYGDHLVLPEAVIEESVDLLPGLDGRKMSKSYNNTIPLFGSRAQLRRSIDGILTNMASARSPGHKDAIAALPLFSIYRAFATVNETNELTTKFFQDFMWSDAKEVAFERIDKEIAPMREHYTALVADPAGIERILQRGAEKARETASPFMAELKQAVGLRRLVANEAAVVKVKTAKVAAPAFKQYREADGRFYFKLLDANARLLLQSQGYDTPKDAASAIAVIKTGGAAALVALQGAVAVSPDTSADDLRFALEFFAPKKASLI